MILDVVQRKRVLLKRSTAPVDVRRIVGSGGDALALVHLMNQAQCVNYEGFLN
jgi:hypothetical protein